MKTRTIQIGNSDDKLTQMQWAKFYAAVDMFVNARSEQVHFSGLSRGDAPWQNAAWVFTIHENTTKYLQGDLSRACAEFRQDSIAWLEGETEFITEAGWKFT